MLGLVVGFIAIAAWWLWFSFNPMHAPPFAPFIAIGLAIIVLLMDCQ